jgi:hypothetical protein
MATVKTQIVNREPRIITKTIDGERRVSCSCCGECFWENYDIDNFIPVLSSTRSQISFENIATGCGDEDAFNGLKPNNNYKKRSACLRWLLRQVVLINGAAITISRPIGGPTTNNRDLNELLFECVGLGKPSLANGEEYDKCYLYEFEFYGWALSGTESGGPAWISSDFIYDIYRADEGPSV